MRDDHKVMVIDNDYHTLESLSDMLEINGYEVSSFQSGMNAIDALEDAAPDIIVCDLRMEGMDGYAVLESVRGIKGYEHIPFLFLTGVTEESRRRQGMITGADDFIIKPFKMDELLASIATALKRHTERTAKEASLFKALSEKERAINQLNFLTNHELRANLAKVLQVLDMVKAGQLQNETALDILCQAAERLDDSTVSMNQLLMEHPSMETDNVGKKDLKFDHILFIDDDQVQMKLNHLLIKKWLDPSQVTMFDNGISALEYLSQNVPDVIFLDINMPGLSGLEVLSLMESRGIEVPVIMLSSSMDTAQINTCYNYGNVVSYQVKPLAKAKLEQLLAI